MASSSDLNIVVDVVVPAVFVIALFIINGFVLRFILRKRREYDDVPQQLEAMEKPTTSAAAATASAELQAPVADTDDSCSIEMERL